MSQSELYNVCCRYHGRMVRIRCKDGSVHLGEITRVGRDMVWIRPNGYAGGYGYGFYGGFGRDRFRSERFGIGFAFGAITGIALASAFFW
ncbi:MAG: hypothetical protein ABWX58_08335 [Psychrobacillus psychrotolerans]